MSSGVPLCLCCSQLVITKYLRKSRETISQHSNRMDSPTVPRTSSQLGLFSLSCLVSVGTKTDAVEHDVTTLTPHTEDSPTFQSVAIGGHASSKIVCAYCSNGTLLFRSINENGVAKVSVSMF